MGQLQVNHIKNVLKKRFESLVDIADVPAHTPPADREATLLTRALAAFVVAELAEIDDVTAARGVVDGHDDNGIDAFHFDPAKHLCYLVQSKWSNTGTNSIKSDATLKFVQGFRDFLANDMEQFGKLKKRAAEVDQVVTDSDVRFVLIVAYTGEPQLTAIVRKPIDQLLKAENPKDDELISFRPLRQSDLYSMIAARTTGAKAVDFTIMLHEWGEVTDPYKAYYGQMALDDISPWKQYGQWLYDRNIRGFKGNTEVNDAIVKTARNDPANFWYFNNGITILCEKVARQPIGGKSNRSSGTFDCKGASVVNGAQTIGSILAATEAGSIENARVLVRLISLEKCPETFGPALTRATNTQNRIEKRDFAAQDQEQARLQQQISVELGKMYSYKTGDPIPSVDDGCTLDEAAVAIACAHKDINLSTQAKREVSKLYDDITKPPYTVLFNAGLTSLKLWRAVEVLRAVEKELKDRQSTLLGRDRLVAVHGNRFVLHGVFRKIPRLDDPGDTFDLGGVPNITEAVLTRTIAAVSKHYEKAYPASLFKNMSKCKRLAGEL